MLKFVGVSLLLVALTVQSILSEVPSDEIEVNLEQLNDTAKVSTFAAAAKCNLNYSCHKGRRYYFETGTKLTRDNADNFCRSIGMRLVSVEDCEENTFITNLLRFSDCDNEDYWTSGYNNGNKVWYWNTGALVNYTNWKRGEPTYKKNEKCLYYRNDYLQWKDGKCDQKIYSICESNMQCV